MTNVLKNLEDYDNQMKHKSREIEKVKKELVLLENGLNNNLN